VHVEAKVREYTWCSFSKQGAIIVLYLQVSRFGLPQSLLFNLESLETLVTRTWDTYNKTPTRDQRTDSTHRYTRGQDPVGHIQPHVPPYPPPRNRDWEHTDTSLLTHLLFSHRWLSATCDPPTERAPTQQGSWIQGDDPTSNLHTSETPLPVSPSPGFYSLFFYVYCHTTRCWDLNFYHPFP